MDSSSGLASRLDRVKLGEEEVKLKVEHKVDHKAGGNIIQYFKNQMEC